MRIEDRTEQLAAVHSEVFGADAKPRNGHPRPAQPVDMSDRELLDRAMSAKNGALFSRLWTGSDAGHSSSSEGDLALCNLLAFWCGGDAGRIDSMFRSSSRMREKWDENHSSDGRTYGQMTIETALASVRDFYNPDNGDDIGSAWQHSRRSSRPAEPKEDEPPIAPSFRTISNLIHECPSLRDPIVDNLLRVGETMNVIAPPKFSKSWAAMDLAIHVALGRCWLGKFMTRQRNVLILDNELHPQTLANRIPKVAQSRGILPSELDGNLFVESLRGKLRDIFAMRSYFAGLEKGQFGMIVLDAFYRFLPRESDENSNADLAAIYNAIDSYADMLGCCFVLIHHSSKGSQGQKSVTDVGAGAGAQARAADSHLIFRAHETDGAVVVDAAVRSWPPLQPFCMRFEHPIWKLAEDLDPTQLRQENRRRPKEEAEQAEPKVVWTPESFVSAFIGKDPKSGPSILIAAEAAEMSERKAKRFMDAAEEAGLIHRWEFGPRSAVKFSTIEQPVTATAKEGK